MKDIIFTVALYSIFVFGIVSIMIFDTNIKYSDLWQLYVFSYAMLATFLLKYYLE